MTLTSSVLTYDFYKQASVTTIARQLIGKKLVTCINGDVTAGMIVETEAYSWIEKGCHAYGNKKTPRTEIMFENGGRAYIYLCYGMYNLFNVTTNTEDKAEAVLIRSVEPVAGIDIMRKRRKVTKDIQLTSGPGKLTQALGITRKQNRQDLTKGEIWIESSPDLKPRSIISAKRIGIEYAGADADLLWRFYLRDNIWVSKTID